VSKTVNVRVAVAACLLLTGCEYQVSITSKPSYTVADTITVAGFTAEVYIVEVQGVKYYATTGSHGEVSLGPEVPEVPAKVEVGK
jgi:hypothetical protein